jgi:hypothetical protein
MADPLGDAVKFGVVTGVGLGVMGMAMKGMNNMMPKAPRRPYKRKKARRKRR